MIPESFHHRAAEGTEEEADFVENFCIRYFE
jgi:hypothetical protein